MKRKRIAGILILMVSLNMNVYGANQETVNTSSEKSISQNELTLTMEEAVEKGLKNSIILNKVKNQAEIASLIKENSEDSKNDIYSAVSDISSARNELDNGRSTLYDKLGQLDSGEAAFEHGLAPQDIPTQLGIISRGENIDEALDNMIQRYVDNNPKYKDLPDYMKAQIKAQIKAEKKPELEAQVEKGLSEGRSQVNGGLKQLDEKTQEYVNGKSKYDLTLQFGMTSVASKLSTSTITSLEPIPLADLLVEMSKVQDKVTSYSVNIYKNKLALKIQNSYYDALKQEKLLDAKNKAMERGKTQYEYANYAYQVGAKSKDDMILAKSYYNGTTMAYNLQEKDYNNAMTELKKDLNMPLDTKLKLVEETADPKMNFDLTQGMNSGLRTRLEIKMADAQVELYKELRRAVDNSNYKSYDNEYKEVELLVKKAEIELQNTKLEVESDIRKSYETVATMEKVSQTANELKGNAEETVEIAKLKYDVGFGADNALLKNLNLTDLSGTMVEIIAAEENLANIEAKVIEATNGYKLAKVKYLNDIGILPYK